MALLIKTGSAPQIKLEFGKRWDAGIPVDVIHTDLKACEHDAEGRLNCGVK